ncbi:MAG: hypothetical protein KatS3mg012_0992 [Gaiellaceae bacterium]|jgi:hypothetical protein|nr:MAG: hypothetical protein KatS3mg012_0992 [Gaiellaceae bacterium]
MRHFHLLLLAIGALSVAAEAIAALAFFGRPASARRLSAPFGR